MKKQYKIKSYSVGFALVALSFSACTSDLSLSENGTGIVRMNVSMNSSITRGDITGEEEDALRENCVVYISDKVGLLHKWVGLSNVPSELTLKYDNYLAEAWAGDSVSVSYDKKFYKGKTQFSVSAETPQQQVVIRCKIANVVGSVNTQTILADRMKDVVVTFSTSRGSLDLNEENLYQKAYFMMPDDETTLHYKVTGKSIDGKPFSKDGNIENVIQGHEYRLNFKADPSESTTGGVFFDIAVEEYDNEIEDEVVIYGRPAFSWSDPSIAVGSQLINIEQQFKTQILKVAAYNGGFKSLKLETENMADYIGNNEYDLANMDAQALASLEANGIRLDRAEPNKDGLHIWYITFKDNLLNRLPSVKNEYVLNVIAVDLKDKENSMKVRIATSNEAIKYDDPIVIEFATFNADKTAVNASSASIPVRIVDGSKYLALQYKKASDDSWNEQIIANTRANISDIVELTNLEENCTYDYRAVAGEKSDDQYEFESPTYQFTTEKKFKIPFGDMESWYKNGKSWEISTQEGLHTFWDTGNHGSTTMGEDYNITTQSFDYKNSGSSSACLKSQFVGVLTLGKFAAGNLFAGTFHNTVSTKGAILTFGQSYNGSHPKALRVYVNYRPGIVDYSTINDLPKNSTDNGQIFIALASAPSELNTAEGKMFNKDASNILAYGEKTWSADFGNDGILEAYDIPISYYEKAKNIDATHIIIVCSASKYGDYFTGSSKSVMYVDDFELIY